MKSIFNQISLEDGQKKYMKKASNGEVSVVINKKFQVIKLKHPNLSARELETLGDYFFLKNVEDLLSLDLNLLYQIYQKKVLDLDLEESDELDDYEEFIDGIELQERSIFSRPLNDLREIALFIKYPDTNGEVLCDQIEGHLICRCFGITKEQINRLLEENPEINLKELNLTSKAGTGCGSCMDDLKVLMELMQKKQNPSPIEWMIEFNQMVIHLGHQNWGKFIGTEENIIQVQLQSMSKESFEQFYQNSGAKNLIFKFLG